MTTQAALLIFLVPLLPSQAAADELSWQFRAVLSVNVALHAADITTSVSGQEANPALIWLHGKPVAFVSVKTGLAVASTVTKVRIYRTKPRLAWALVIAETAVYGWVVQHNLRAR